ncbi:uncharacterized protein LOC131151466 [Malania oleifera]|uniref:uncharacterized protein LOC131151466 n=1 Tax=Malania oleifera TaxID=397392 RepID=UPI0025AEC6D6|nr:uncharacterized protein LOC131151466 [Malania oleifera]
MDDQTLGVTDAGSPLETLEEVEVAATDASAKSKRSKLRVALCIAKYAVCGVCAFLGIQFLVMAVYIAVIVMFFPMSPSLRLHSLSVSHFKISRQDVASAWAASFSIQNPNDFRAFNLNIVEAPITYKKDMVSAGSAVQVDAVPNKEVRFAVTFGFARWKVDEGVQEAMQRDRDREQGRMKFDLSMAMQGELVVAKYFRKPIIMNAVCMRLNVTVNFSTGAGLWIDSAPKDCIVLM